MAKYSEGHYDGPNGMHGVPLWRVAGFSLNNSATNCYLFMTWYVAYYLTGFVGAGVILAGSFSMIARIWDGVTDPLVGLIVDRTNGKFGKNRPFMVIGNITMFVSTFLMYNLTPYLPEGFRLIWFFIVNAVFYLGYTCQCIITKAGQSCLTNDPKQRPLFAVFDGIYNTFLWTGFAILAAKLLAKHPRRIWTVVLTTGFYHDMWLIVAILSAIFTAIAVFSIAPKDKSEFFGTGKPVKVGLKDYWETLKGNRAIQMLVVSASTDKLASFRKDQRSYHCIIRCSGRKLCAKRNADRICDHTQHNSSYLRRGGAGYYFGTEKSHADRILGGNYRMRIAGYSLALRRSYKHEWSGRRSEVGIFRSSLHYSQHSPGRLPGRGRKYRYSHDGGLRGL